MRDRQMLHVTTDCYLIPLLLLLLLLPLPYQGEEIPGGTRTLSPSSCSRSSKIQNLIDRSQVTRVTGPDRQASRWATNSLLTG